MILIHNFTAKLATTLLEYQTVHAHIETSNAICDIISYWVSKDCKLSQVKYIKL